MNKGRGLVFSSYRRLTWPQGQHSSIIVILSFSCCMVYFLLGKDKSLVDPEVKGPVKLVLSSLEARISTMYQI